MLPCILVAAAIQLLLDVGSTIALVPHTSIIQDIVFSNYYARINGHNETLPIDRCKSVPVQSEVAFIDGWQAAIENVPTMLLAIPYGALADRIGRKQVLLLVIAGIIMNDAWIRLVLWFHTIFPVRAVLLAGLWQTFGAGSATLSSLTNVLVADACSPEQRTTAFSQIRFARLLSKTISLPLGGGLISYNPWLPMFISLAFMVLGFLAALIMVPETLPPSKTDDVDEMQGLLMGNNQGTNLAQSIFLRLQESLAIASRIGDWMTNNPPRFCRHFSCRLTTSYGPQRVLDIHRRCLHPPRTFRWGMELGPFWIGMAFLVAVGFNLCALLVVSAVKVKDNDEQELLGED
ncbi:Efflux pump ustT [Cladobotryum mycophilum]|uniref:Efflux pump ustT n=1 Tax=Cladobotryum mycophilum TaxID=491253 RepID=A0ABR0ST12_9HYPO